MGLNNFRAYLNSVWVYLSSSPCSCMFSCPVTMQRSSLLLDFFGGFLLILKLLQILLLIKKKKSQCFLSLEQDLQADGGTIINIMSILGGEKGPASFPDSEDGWSDIIHFSAAKLSFQSGLAACRLRNQNNPWHMHKKTDALSVSEQWPPWNPTHTHPPPGTMGLFWKWVLLSDSVLSSMLCCYTSCFSRPSMLFWPEAWVTVFLGSHLKVISTMVSTHCLSSQVRGSSSSWEHAW